MREFKLNWGIYLVILCLPLYLLRLKIFGIPTTVLELMIYMLFLIWFIKKSKILISKSEIRKNFQIPNPKSPNLISKIQYPILLIFLGATLSTIFSSEFLVSAGTWKAYFLNPLLLFLVIINVLKTKKQIKYLLSALGLSGILVGIISLGYYLSNNLTFDGRLKAFYLSPNHLAMYLAPCLIAIFYLLLTTKNRLKKLLWTIGIILLVVVLYLTYSYGAWIGILGSFLFLVFLIIKYLKLSIKKVLLCCSITLLLFFVLFFSQYQSEKFQGLFDSRSPLVSRLIVWKVSWEIAKDHPLLGVGPGMFQKYYLEYQKYFPLYLEWAVPQPHNIFFAFWLQTGILGLIGFLWLLILFFKKGFQLIKVSGFKFQVSGILMLIMLYILIHGLIDTPYWKNDLAVIFWLIIGLMAIVKTPKIRNQKSEKMTNA